MSSVSYNVSNQITPLTFNGQSKYSSDFQTILNKAASSESIVLSGLDDQANTDQSELTAFQGLDSDFSALQTAVTNLATSIGPSALSGSVGNSSLASVSVGTGASAGTYQLEVDNLGSATQMISSSSNQTVTDPTSQNIASGTSFELAVTDPASNGGQTQYTTITNSAGTLDGLVQAINSQSNLGVSASIVNVGSANSPDYRLALQSTDLGAVSISLGTGSSQTFTNIMSLVSSGTNSSYKVDGTAITDGTSDTITLAPGVTANLLQASTGDPTTITVSQSTANAESALQSFVSIYNTVVSGLAAQHGQNAGALSGNSILLVAQQVMTAINGYNSNGNDLSSLGLDLNDDGTLTFNSSEFSSGLGSNFSALSSFLGDTTSGFIGNAANALNSLEDPTTGSIKTSETSLQNDVTSLNSKISDQETQINQDQQNLYQQLSASDAAIFTLTTQETFFQDMFQTETANEMGG